MSYCLEVREVKAYTVRINIRSCLLNMGTKYGSECRLEKMSRRVITHDSASALTVHSAFYTVANLNGTVYDLADMQILAVCALFGIYNIYLCGCGGDNTGIANLTAAFTIEGSFIEKHGEIAIAYFITKRIFIYKSKYLTLSGKRGVACKFRCGIAFENIL